MREISFIEAKELALKMMAEHGLSHWGFEFMDTNWMGGECCQPYEVSTQPSEKAWEKFKATNPEDLGWKTVNGHTRRVYRTRPKLRFSRVWITKYGYECFVDTVLHEIAHALVFERKLKDTKSHGKTWAKLAFSIGVRDVQHGGRWGLKQLAYANKRPPKPQPTEADILANKFKDRQKKLVNAQQQAKKTRTRIKRLTTALKKWERRERLYTKQLTELQAAK